jgi:hypothetical protein
MSARNELLSYFRSKYPNYANVSDDELFNAIKNVYPTMAQEAINKDYGYSSEKTAMGTALSGLARGFTSTFTSIPKILSIIAAGATPEEDEAADFYAYKVGDFLDRKINQLARVNPKYADTFGFGMLPQGLGSMAGFMVGGGILGGVLKGSVAAGMSKTAARTLASGLLGSSVGGSGLYEDAKRFGSDEETAQKAAAFGSLIGTTEMLPIGRIFGKMDDALQGTLRRTMLKESFRGGVEELIQESTQTFLENATAKQLYDAERKLQEGVAEGGAVGLISGVLASAIGIKLGRMKNELATLKEGHIKDTRARMLTDIEKVATEYKKSGVPVTEGNKLSPELDIITSKIITGYADLISTELLEKGDKNVLNKLVADAAEDTMEDPRVVKYKEDAIDGKDNIDNLDIHKVFGEKLKSHSETDFDSKGEPVDVSKQPVTDVLEGSGEEIAKKTIQPTPTEERAPETPKNHIRLYRGMEQAFDKDYDLSKTDAPQGYSTWTDNIELAKQYAGENGRIYYIDLPVEQQGKELISESGDRALFVNNEKKAGLNNVSGNEYLVYNDHDAYTSDMVKEILPTKKQPVKTPKTKAGVESLSWVDLKQVAKENGVKIVGKRSDIEKAINEKLAEKKAPSWDKDTTVPILTTVGRLKGIDVRSGDRKADIIKKLESAGLTPEATLAELEKYVADAKKNPRKALVTHLGYAPNYVANLTDGQVNHAIATGYTFDGAEFAKERNHMYKELSKASKATDKSAAELVREAVGKDKEIKSLTRDEVSKVIAYLNGADTNLETAERTLKSDEIVDNALKKGGINEWIERARGVFRNTLGSVESRIRNSSVGKAILKKLQNVIDIHHEIKGIMSQYDLIRDVIVNDKDEYIRKRLENKIELDPAKKAENVAVTKSRYILDSLIMRLHLLQERDARKKMNGLSRTDLDSWAERLAIPTVNVDVDEDGNRTNIRPRERAEVEGDIVQAVKTPYRKGYVPRIYNARVMSRLIAEVMKIDKLLKGTGVSGANIVNTVMKNDKYANTEIRQMFDYYVNEAGLTPQQAYNITKEIIDSHIEEDFLRPEIEEKIKKNMRESTAAKKTSFEKERTIEAVPDFVVEKDLGKVLVRYVDRMGLRIALAEEFGVDNDVFEDMIQKVTKEDPKEAQLLLKVHNMLNGRYDRSEGYKGKSRDLINAFYSIEYATKIGLGTAVLPNMVQTLYSSALDMGFGRTLQTSLKILGSPAYRQKLKDSGLIYDAANYFLLGHDDDSKLGKISRIVGVPFNLANRFNLYVSAASFDSGVEHYKNRLQTLKKNNKTDTKEFRRRKKFLEQLGFSEKEISKVINGGNFETANFNRLMQRFARDVQLQKNVLREATVFNEPRIRPFLLFKRFGYLQVKLVKDVAQKSFERGDYMPFVRLALAGFFGGEFVWWAKNMLRKILSGEENIRESTTIPGRLLENIGIAGSIGMVSDIMDATSWSDIPQTTLFLVQPVIMADMLKIVDATTKTLEAHEKYENFWGITLPSAAQQYSGLFGSLPRMVSLNTYGEKQWDDRVKYRRGKLKREVLDLLGDGKEKRAMILIQRWNKTNPDAPLTYEDINYKTVLKHRIDKEKRVAERLVRRKR